MKCSETVSEIADLDARPNHGEVFACARKWVGITEGGEQQQMRPTAGADRKEQYEAPNGIFFSLSLSLSLSLCILSVSAVSLSLSLCL